MIITRRNFLHIGFSLAAIRMSMTPGATHAQQLEEPMPHATLGLIDVKTKELDPAIAVGYRRLVIENEPGYRVTWKAMSSWPPVYGLAAYVAGNKEPFIRYVSAVRLGAGDELTIEFPLVFINTSTDIGAMIGDTPL